MKRDAHTFLLGTRGRQKRGVQCAVCSLRRLPCAGAHNNRGHEAVTAAAARGHSHQGKGTRVQALELCCQQLATQRVRRLRSPEPTPCGAWTLAVRDEG